MNKAEKVYHQIELQGRQRIAEKTQAVLRDSAPMIGMIQFPYNLQSINKIYCLLENGYYPYFFRAFSKYG